MTTTNAQPVPAQAQPSAATLKLALVGEQGASQPFYLHVLAKGTPPAKPVKLVDEGGLHPATLDVVGDAKKCNGFPARETGVGMKSWCLKLTGVKAGHQLTGTATGASKGTALALTVTRKNSFLYNPFGVLALGFIAALLLPFFSGRLRELIQRITVDRLLDRNRRAGAQRIVDLDSWVKTERDKGRTYSEIYATLSSVIPKLTDEARKIRRNLKTKSNKPAPLPASHRYLPKARAVARRPLVMTDFVDDETVRTSLEFEKWETALDQLKIDQAALNALRTSIEKTLADKAECRDPVKRAVDQAQAALETIDSPDALANLNGPLGAAQTAYRVAFNTQSCRKKEKVDEAAVPKALVGNYVNATATRLRSLDEEVQTELLVSALLEGGQQAEQALAGLRRVAVKTFSIAGGLWKLETVGGWCAILLAAAVIIAFAGLSVLASTYVTDPLFAGWWKDFALFSAAVGSSAAGAVLGLLAYWKPQAATSK